MFLSLFSSTTHHLFNVCVFVCMWMIYVNTCSRHSPLLFIVDDFHIQIRLCVCVRECQNNNSQFAQLAVYEMMRSIKGRPCLNVCSLLMPIYIYVYYILLNSWYLSNASGGFLSFSYLLSHYTYTQGARARCAYIWMNKCTFFAHASFLAFFFSINLFPMHYPRPTVISVLH